MIPGLNANMIPKGREKESTARIKRFLCMMDSMTNEELDSDKPLTDYRLIRIAKGSGTRPEEVAFLLEEHKKFKVMVEKMGKLKLNDSKDLQQLNRNPKQLMQAMGQAIDPRLLQQIGGMGNLMNTPLFGSDGKQTWESQSTPKPPADSEPTKAKPSPSP